MTLEAELRSRSPEAPPPAEGVVRTLPPRPPLCHPCRGLSGPPASIPTLRPSTPRPRAPCPNPKPPRWWRATPASSMSATSCSPGSATSRCAQRQCNGGPQAGPRAFLRVTGFIRLLVCWFVACLRPCARTATPRHPARRSSPQGAALSASPAPSACFPPLPQVHRSEANGGDMTFNTPEELKEAYTSGGLHPGTRGAGRRAAPRGARATAPLASGRRS
jgi:hypothetical protein